METMLFFGKEALIPSILPITSILSSPQKSKLHFSISHISRNPWTRTRPVFCPSILALNESITPGNGKNNNNRIGGRKMGASVALACIVGIFGVNLKMSSKAIAGPRELYQKAPHVVVGYPFGGRSALKSLLDISVQLSSSSLGPPSRLTLSSRPSAEEVNEIKMEAVRVMKSGQPEDAVLLLRTAYNSRKDDPEPAYNLEMALVEILICQGKYMEASQCNCLKEEQRLPSDGRFPLYKAIICTMLDNKEEAKKWWSEFMEAVEGDFDPTSFKM